MFSFFKKKFKKSEPEQKQPELEQESLLPEANDSNKEEVPQEAQTHLVNKPEPSATPIVAEVATVITEPEQVPESVNALRFDDLDAPAATAAPETPAQSTVAAPAEPEVEVTPAPTPVATAMPTPAPTVAATAAPTAAPTVVPTVMPTVMPTAAPTAAPVLEDKRTVNAAA